MLNTWRKFSRVELSAFAKNLFARASLSEVNRSRIALMTRERNAHANSHADRLPSTIGGMTKLAYARAKAAGIALEPLLRTADLTSHQIEHPQAGIRVRDQIKFLNLAAAALKDDLLGFHLAQTADLRELGLLYYLLASSETLIDALHRAARYSSIVNEGVSLRCVDSRFVRISFHCIGIGRHLDTHQIECTMTTVVRICRQLTGLRLLPERVRLMHHRPRNAEFAKVFGSNVEFGAAADDVTFSNNIRQSPVTSADPYLHKLLISYCEEAIAYRPRIRSSFRSSVENAVVPLLPHGKARISEIARQLGVSQRTLTRRLSEEGLTFSELLNSLRSDLANRHLADRDLAISQIAWLLGYRDVGAFSHAFKRWTGKAPGKARAEYAA
jgi:AraC-like DNA-binding protein